MNQPIVSSAAPIILIGGAEVAPDTLTTALKWGETVVCADGGADTALWAELQPAAVIGDMDSISEAAKEAFVDLIHPIAEQDSTDFDKALRSIASPLVLAVGFLGQRLDHSLAALHVLLKYRDRPVVLLGADDVVFLAPEHTALTLPVGMRVSLMPFPNAQVSTKGLKWELNDGAMSAQDFIGTSNEVANPDVEIRATGGLAILLPPQALGAVVSALTDAVLAQ